VSRQLRVPGSWTEKPERDSPFLRVAASAVKLLFERARSGGAVEFEGRRRQRRPADGKGLLYMRAPGCIRSSSLVGVDRAPVPPPMKLTIRADIAKNELLEESM